MTGKKLIRGRWVITGAEDDDPLLEDGAVLIEGGSIAEVGDWRTLRTDHPDAQTIGSDDLAVMPGLINAHHHSHGVSSLQHGIPDMLLETWILSHARARQTDPYLDALLSAASQLRTGVTAAVDVVSGGGNAASYAELVEGKARGYADSGMRVAIAAGISTQSFLVSGRGEDDRFLASLPDDLRPMAESRMPDAGRVTEDEYFAAMESVWRAHAGHSRIDIWFGPPGPQWVSDEFMQRIAERAEAWNTRIQTHVDESIYEMIHGPRFYGRHTMLHLQELGVLSERFSIAHGVWLTEPEIRVMAETGAAVSHNPSSNLRLRAGIAPLNGLLAAGVTVGLGMDGTTLNEDEDMFTEMRLAMRLHRTPVLGGPAPEPCDVFTMATLGGAKLMGKGERLGRIAPGRAADLVLVRLERLIWPWIAPEADPRLLMLMRARAGDVDTVLVDGEVVLRNGVPTQFDLQRAGRELSERLRATPHPDAGAELVTRLLPYLEAWYADWEVPSLEPWIRYNSK